MLESAHLLLREENHDCSISDFIFCRHRYLFVFQKKNGRKPKREKNQKKAMIWSSVIAFVGLAGILSVIFPENEKPEVAKQEAVTIEKTTEQIVAPTKKKEKFTVSQEIEGIALCRYYFKAEGFHEGSTYQLFLGQGEIEYNDKDNTATFFAEATIANAAGAKSKKNTSCTVNADYRVDLHGYRAFDYIIDFKVLGQEPTTIEKVAPAKKEQKKTTSPSNNQKWYEGGTLHKSTVSEWKNASYRNKLATSADWVTHMYQSGSFTQEVNDVIIQNSVKSGLDGIKFVAEKLVTGLDESVNGTNDFDNQSMPDVVALFMSLAEWLK